VPTDAPDVPRVKTKTRTGSAATKSADNIWMHRLANLALVLAVVAGGVGSIDGLLAAAETAFAPAFHWVLPTALDVFLVGAAVATLALRERRAWGAVVFCIVVSLALVAFSAVVNFTYWQSVNEPGTLAYEVGPFIKGSMPVLLLVALEILAAINTTKRRSTPTSVTRLRAEVARLRGEGRLRAKVAKLKAKRAARA
jgi:peptidoglycan/LPS O-acetylase OafA/YrhL